MAGESLEDGSLAADDQCDNEGQGGTVNAGSSLLHLLTIDKDTAVCDIYYNTFNMITHTQTQDLPFAPCKSLCDCFIPPTISIICKAKVANCQAKRDSEYGVSPEVKHYLTTCLSCLMHFACLFVLITSRHLSWLFQTEDCI